VARHLDLFMCVDASTDGRCIEGSEERRHRPVTGLSAGLTAAYPFWEPLWAWKSIQMPTPCVSPQLKALFRARYAPSTKGNMSAYSSTGCVISLMWQTALTAHSPHISPENHCPGLSIGAQQQTSTQGRQSGKPAGPS